MKNATQLLFLMGLASTSLFAQEVSGYEKVAYFSPADIEVEDVNLSSKNAIAQADHCKMAFTVENTSTDLVMYDSKESEFVYEFGKSNPSVKSFILSPGDKKTKTLLVKGDGNYLQKGFKLEVKGLYKIPLNGDVTAADQFQLPASMNNFTAGNFKVQLKKYDATTKEASAVFECTYIGDGIGLVDASSLSVTTNKNKSKEQITHANDDKKADIEILNKNESIDFKAVFHIPGKIADMQFATMMVNWNNTFVETSAQPIEGPVLQFDMDEAATKAAN
jgi:hypothetical protein